MKSKSYALIAGVLILLGCSRNNQLVDYPVVEINDLVVLPDVVDSKPDVQSPVLTTDQREFVLAGFDGGKYSWIDVTVENGETFDYKQNLRGKGNQLLPDAIDFPHFAEHGLHSNKELSRTASITGRSVAQITVDGRPWASSGVGFLADDETIISVIWGDNKIVKKLGLTHLDLARPLFHVWNTGWMMGHMKSKHKLKNLSYNNEVLSLNLTGSRGWQESIFDDEILGTGHMEIRSKMSEVDLEFIKSNYSSLSEGELETLISKLSFIHTGELVLFYISRYGFYEGHNEYRPDPLAIAYIFGLKSIIEIHEAANEDLYTYFTTHFTQNPEFQDSKLKTQSSRLKTQDSRDQIKTKDPGHRTQENPKPETQNTQPTKIDSLITSLKTAGRNWNIPAEQLIAIGDKAIPCLVGLLFDKDESQWNRRVAAMTLNQIHSPKTVAFALRLLFDKSEGWDIRNQIIPSLQGFDLSDEKHRLWELYNDPESESYRGNIARLLVNADTSKAYLAYIDLFEGGDGYMKMQSMNSLATLRPHESTYWYLQGVQGEDWWTACTAMDSIINLDDIDPTLLLQVFNQPNASEEIRWRITHIFGNIDIPDSHSFLEEARQDTSWLIKMEAAAGLTRLNQ